MKRTIALASVLCLCFFTLSGAAALPQEKKPEAEKAKEKAEIKPGKEKGKQERFFAHPLQKVKEATIDAMKAIEFEVKKDKGNELEAKRKRHVGVFVGSGGETLVVQLREAEEGGAKGTRVIAETKKGFVGRAGQKSWSNAVLDETERILKAEKQ
jgi:hypothetical protein